MRALALATAAAAVQVFATPAFSATPEALRPESGLQAVLTLHAVGSQIYECAKNAQDSWAWQFKQPQAELFDEMGHQIGQHGAGPSWTLNDGSSLVGQMQASAPAPAAGAIPWLLLGVRSRSGSGRLDGVAAIQRLSTQGGVAPTADRCHAATAGQIAKVAYSADYTFWAPAGSRP